MKIFKTKNLIIGSGPGGVTIGYYLSKSKQDVIMIEEGKYANKTPNSICESLMSLWKNNGITPVLGDKNLILGQGKCVGGGSTLNAGLVWNTPNFIINKWKKRYGNSFFDNFDSNYKLIQNRLGLKKSNKANINKHTKRIIDGAKKLNWKYIPVPENYTEEKINSDTFGVSENSLINNYINDFKNNGGQLIPNLSLIRFVFINNKIEEAICFDLSKKIYIKIKADNYFLCCGSIQTPYILKKNKIITNTISSQFHCNLRFLPIFRDKINIKKKTFASHEIDEFQKDGLMIIPSEFKLKYLSSVISSYSNENIKNILNSINYGGLYVAQLRMNSKIKINSMKFFKDPVLTNYLNEDDKRLINFSINKMIKLLFESGANEIFLPYSKNYKINKNNFSRNLNNLNYRDLNMISVHIMSSIPMFNNKIIDERGKIQKLNNLIISDGSILPENIGQSPQGTIMLFSMEIVERFLDDKK